MRGRSEWRNIGPTDFYSRVSSHDDDPAAASETSDVISLQASNVSYADMDD